MTGILYGVGVGPGDPELVTLKACRLIKSAEILAYPAPDVGESFARNIAKSLIPDGIEEVPIIIPMQEKTFPAQEIYDDVADNLSKHLKLGKIVVVLCQGDPFLYGSFMYLFARLAYSFHVEVIPGVSSLTACAAAARQPLCARTESLSILPATLNEEDLRIRITQSHSCAIVKVGRNLPKVRSIIEELGMTDRSLLVSHATLPDQSVVPISNAPNNPPYFSTILIRGQSDYVAL